MMETTWRGTSLNIISEEQEEILYPKEEQQIFKDPEFGETLTE